MKIALVLTLGLLACSSHHDKTADAKMVDSMTSTPPTAYVVAGDFTAGHPGTMATVNTQTLSLVKNVAPAGAVGDDPQLRAFGSDLYVINRSDGDNITILSPPALSLVEQLGTGSSSNPYDVAVRGQNLYVPIYGGSGVAVLTRNSTTVSVIDLSAGATNPGIPDCGALALVGSQLFVACEELDSSFAATVPGKIFVIDTTNNTVTTSFNLTNENPVGEFRQMPNGDLAIETANYTTGAGCIEQITTTGTLMSAGCVVSNTTLGGTVNRFEIEANAGSDAIMWLSVASAGFASQTLYSYDLTTSKLSPAVSASTEQIGDFAVCPDGTIVASDQTKNASGIRVFRNSHEVTTSALAIGLDTLSTYAVVCE